jgi:hypothetical protein
MKWFDKWVLQRAKRIRSREQTLYEVDSLSHSITSGVKSSDSTNIGTSRHRMSFVVYRANGGMMVEYNRYDERKDQHQCELHIVHPDQDLGDALAKIVTFESLKS